MPYVIDFDPIAIELGPFVVRWYALAYIVGLIGGWQYTKAIVRRRPHIIRPVDMDDFLLWATVGVVLGGRLGYVLLYAPGYFLEHPLQILEMWKGGMAFHGGLMGVVVAMYLFGRRRGMGFLAMTDVVGAAAPVGLFFGRIANFVNGELWGRPTDSSIGMIFPRAGSLPRHPTPLYEAALEGLLLFVLCFVLIFVYRMRWRPGVVGGAFAMGYGVVRTLVHVWRESTDAVILGPLEIAFGQLYSIPMILLGAAMIWWGLTHPPVAEPASLDPASGSGAAKAPKKGR